MACFERIAAGHLTRCIGIVIAFHTLNKLSIPNESNCVSSVGMGTVRSPYRMHRGGIIYFGLTIPARV